jgi:hypothetical protein
MKPILFNTQMVQAILEGRKTTTRRIAKDIKSLEVREGGFVTGKAEDKYRCTFFSGNQRQVAEKLSGYKVGDILYVRETWMIQSMKNFEKNIKFLYKAEPQELKEVHVSSEIYEKLIKFESKNGWQPSLFMPKEAARIFLRVKNVKIERLQDITEEGIRAEGITEEFPPHARDKFQELWDSTTKEYRWRLNPWVWVIEFERIDKSEVDQ